ncbi:unnamed protein product [Heligmosomoides polygyrus]|uniref:Lipoprotein n=1 Tax=Heligmosomoides polygyrus TaxID=6339 RepID=A0A183FRF6_HELPZ|nr:unnamed protein product [Heligmosomoides polygyrus]
MKVVLCAVHVMLFMGAMAWVALDGCFRTPEEVQTANKDPQLRGEIKKYLNLTLEDNDSITWFTVYDSYLDGVANVYLVEIQKTGKNVTFMYGSPNDGQDPQVTAIPYSKYIQYLGCEILAGDGDNDY